MRLNKLVVARSQLLTAIDLFFSDRDPVSVHSLAGAAREIIENLCRKASIEPFSEHVLRTYPEKTRIEVWKIMNLYRNAFKHASEKNDDDDADILAQFSDEANDFLIFIAVEDYLRLRGQAPVPFQVFQVWFGAVHADRLAPHVSPLPYERLFPGIGTRPRDAQKLLGRNAVAESLNDAELLVDARTEPVDLPIGVH